jgi:hypothetical protein
MALRSRFEILACAVVGAMMAPIATALYVSSQDDVARNDREGLGFIDDIVRASQAAVSAERMISMGRAYRLTQEPDLLARAHAAEAKLHQTLHELETSANALQEGPLFDSVRISADRYGETLQGFLADSNASGRPHAVAETLRRRVIPARDRFEADLEEVITHRQQQIAGLRASTGDVPRGAVPLMVGICVLGVLASILLARAALERSAGALVPNGADDSEPPPDGRPPFSGGYTRGQSGAPADRRSAPGVRGAAIVLHFPRQSDEGASRR